MRTFAALLVPALASCGGEPLADVRATAATFSLDWNNVALIAGISEAHGSLDLVDDVGVSHSFPVRAMGPLVGVIAGGALDVNDPGTFCCASSTDLADVELPIAGDALLGDYSGTLMSAHGFVGYDDRALANPAGVKLHKEGTGLGLDLGLGVTWLSFVLDE